MTEGSTRQDQSADCAMGAQKSADAKARKARTRKAVKEILAAKDLTDPRIDIKPHVTIGIDLGISEDATDRTGTRDVILAPLGVSGRLHTFCKGRGKNKRGRHVSAPSMTEGSTRQDQSADCAQSSIGVVLPIAHPISRNGDAIRHVGLSSWAPMEAASERFRKLERLRGRPTKMTRIIAYCRSQQTVPLAPNTNGYHPGTRANFDTNRSDFGSLLHDALITAYT